MAKQTTKAPATEAPQTTPAAPQTTEAPLPQTTPAPPQTTEAPAPPTTEPFVPYEAGTTPEPPSSTTEKLSKEELVQSLYKIPTIDYSVRREVEALIEAGDKDGAKARLSTLQTIDYGRVSAFMAELDEYFA